MWPLLQVQLRVQRAGRGQLLASEWPEEEKGWKKRRGKKRMSMSQPMMKPKSKGERE